MRTRARFQEGTLVVEGKTPCYYVRYRVYDESGNSKQKKTLIGLVSRVSKREANKLKSEIVTKKTNQLPVILSVANRGDMLFKEFYLTRFILLKTAWTEAYRVGFTYYLDRFVLPKIGGIALKDIDKVIVQSLLNAMASRYSQSTIKHTREKMMTIFGEAMEQEFIIKNPVAKTQVPSEARPPEQPILTEQQLIGIIDRLTSPKDLSIFMIGTFCALRTSEVFGMPWGNFFYDEVTRSAYFMVDQISYRGKVYARTKNKSSKARVPIGRKTLEAILAWRSECKNVSPKALMFPSTNYNGRSQVGGPMYPGIWLQKKIQPIARELGIGFNVNFRATRRTASSLVQEHGGSLATAQSLLRHSSASTTANIYSKPIPDSVKVAVNSYEDRVYAARPKPVLIK